MNELMTEAHKMMNLDETEKLVFVQTDEDFPEIDEIAEELLPGEIAKMDGEILSTPH